MTDLEPPPEDSAGWRMVEWLQDCPVAPCQFVAWGRTIEDSTYRLRRHMDDEHPEVRYRMVRVGE